MEMGRSDLPLWEAKWTHPHLVLWTQPCICRSLDWFKSLIWSSCWARAVRQDRPGRRRLALFLQAFPLPAPPTGAAYTLGLRTPHSTFQGISCNIWSHISILYRCIFLYVPESCVNTCFKVLVYQVYYLGQFPLIVFLLRFSHIILFPWRLCKFGFFLDIVNMFCSDSGFSYIPLKSVLLLLQHTNNLVGIEVQTLPLDGSSDIKSHLSSLTGLLSLLCISMVQGWTY